MTDMEPAQSETFLSSSVKQLICAAGKSTDLFPDCLNPDGLINWKYLETVLLEDEVDSPEYFIESAKALAPVFNTVHKHFKNLDSKSFEGFMNCFEKYTLWTASPESAKWLGMKSTEYTPNHKEEILEWLLLYFPLLERSLGDLYLVRGSQCPSMLKDLLLTEELKFLLNSTVIRFLRILIGPPISLNLRNVIWHGFPLPGEIPEQYVHVLICLLPSIGRLLEENCIDVKTIGHREFFLLPKLPPEISHSLMSRVDDHLEDFKDMIENCKGIHPAMKPMWILGAERYTLGQYGKCASVLLPQLEHHLRGLFAQTNQCPNRIFTAESAAFFTTFDEMLVPIIPNGEENKLLTLLGHNILDCLLDLLEYPEGPRIRDKLSHGEVSVEKFPKELAGLLITVCGSLFDRVINKDCGNFAMNNYESLFHPVSLLKKELCECAKHVNSWLSLTRPNQGEIECNIDWTNEETFKDLAQNYKAVLSSVEKIYDRVDRLTGLSVFGENYLDAICDLVSKKKLLTTFRYSSNGPAENESETVGILRRILHEVSEISRIISVSMETRYQQWKRKELRSRQRNTYRRMLDSIPFISAGLRLIVSLVGTHYHSLDNIKDLFAQPSKLLKLFRFTLQYCENVKSNSNLDKNRWEESVELTKELMEKVSAF